MGRTVLQRLIIDFLTCISTGSITTTFSGVRAPVSTIECLRTLTTLALVRPDAFTYGVLASNKVLGILLYGPPGTGKTHLAKAVAKESGATMLEISGADVLQQYVGEGEKVVRAIFTLARKLDPCIVFIDEADAIFRARADDERQYHRELINQFLREWDGIASSTTKGGFMMLATNRPYDLDEAVLRRLPRRILIDIPSVEDREAILNIHLRGEQLDPDVHLAAIAALTPNHTGSDLKNLCVAAAFACVFEEVQDVQSAFASVATSRKALVATKGMYPAKRTLKAKHFDKAMEEISSTIDSASISRIRNFHKRRREQMPERRIELPEVRQSQKSRLNNSPP